MNFSPQPLDPKRDLGRFSALSFIYSLAMLLIVFIYTIFVFLIKYYENGFDTDKTEKIVEQFMASDGGAYILFSLAGIMIYAFYQRRQPLPAAAPPQKKKMTVKVFLLMICFLWFAQLFATLTDHYMEFMLQLFGLQLPDSMLGDSSQTSLSLLLYSSLMAPISEELFFRGVGLTSLEKHGRVFAIIFTALMFGIFHENFSQLYFAALIGLGFGYLAFEYSLFWPIFFHMFNNLLIAEGLSFAAHYIPVDAVNLFRYLCMMAGTAVVLVFFSLKWPLVKAYLQTHSSPPGTYRRALTSFWFWFFSIIGICTAFLPVLLLYLENLLKSFPD